MKCCYITVDGILCIQLVIGFIACRMLSHIMYFVRNGEIKMFNQSSMSGVADGSFHGFPNVNDNIDTPSPDDRPGELRQHKQHQQPLDENRQSRRPDEWHIMSEHSQTFKCNICQKRVLKHSYHMGCSLCKRMCHLKCLPRINKDDQIYTKRHESLFYCTKCLKETFAFNQLDDTCINLTV